MEVLFFEIILSLFRIPGALFLAASTTKGFDHWMERRSSLGVAATGAAVVGMLIYMAVLASG